MTSGGLSKHHPTRTKFFLLVLIPILIVGCHSIQTFTITPISTENRLSTTPAWIKTIKPPNTSTQSVDTTSAGNKQIPTNTSSSPTFQVPTLQIPTGPPTIPPETNLSYQCLEELTSIPDEPISRGELVLASRVIENDHYLPEAYLMDMESGNMDQLVSEHESLLDFKVSPDRKHLAYQRVLYGEGQNVIAVDLITANADGQRLITIPWEDGWSRIVRWLDDQSILINIFKRQDDRLKMHGAFLLLNPFTGERQILAADYPGISTPTSSSFPNWSGMAITKYNPQLTRVIYPLLTGHENEYTYGIWNLESHHLQASLESLFTYNPGADYYPEPVWSPDGESFIVEVATFDPIEFDTYLINQNGQVNQLTHLFQYNNYRLTNYAWSPNNRYIAGWMSYRYFGNTNHVELVVLDKETMQIVDYCIGVTDREGDGTALAPIWSPDSTQLVVMDWYTNEHRRLILADLDLGFSVKIADDVEPAGWMLTP